MSAADMAYRIRLRVWAACATMRHGRRMILLGNKPDWRSGISSVVSPWDFILHPGVLDEETAQEGGVSLIIPLKLQEYELLRQLPLAACKALLPLSQHVHLADNKAALNIWLRDNGFGGIVPRHYVSHDDVCFPVVVKGHNTAWGRRTIVAEDKKALMAALEVAATWPLGYFLQEAVRGQQEYATHIVAYRGRILFKATNITGHRSDLFVKGEGESPIWTKTISNYAPPEIEKIVLYMDYTGAACFDYKMEDGAVRLFELNPRPGASFPRTGRGYLRAYAHGVALQQKDG